MLMAILLASIYPGSLGDAPVHSSPSVGSAGYPSYYSVETDTSHHGYAPSQGYESPPSPPSVAYGTPKSPVVYGPPGPYDASQHDQAYSLKEESPFIQQRLFNTAVALTVPLFSFQLPRRAPTHGGVDLANQVIQRLLLPLIYLVGSILPCNFYS